MQPIFVKDLLISSLFFFVCLFIFLTIEINSHAATAATIDAADAAQVNVPYPLTLQKFPCSLCLKNIYKPIIIF